jgi:ABC-type glycerol-3-phosphate transport system substrate-binding protein
MLYWNKDLFNAASLPLPPRDWTELMSQTASLTRRNTAGQIEVAGAALGRASNIPLFKHVLEALLLQENPQQNSFLQDTAAANSATRSYTNFALSSQPHFSWHALLPLPRALFSRNDLGMMIDYASYAFALAQQNPHLNFAIAPLPKINQNAPVTGGALWGITVSRASSKSVQAWRAALLLTGKDFASSLIAAANFAPARRDLLDSSNPLHAAVLQAKRIPDQSPAQTSAILAEMIDSVSDGKKKVSEAVNEAGRKFGAIR